MNINIICIGKLKEKYLKDAQAEYSKRLSRFCKLKITELPEAAISENYSEAEKETALKKEADMIISALAGADVIISLCVEGKQKSSEDFADFISKKMIEGKSNFAFIIGSSCGMSENVKKISHLRLSFSEMTFPHQLMRVILLEQIYRGFKIISNEKYHK
ncbi:MAG: 23S rRNA (pseudouridine(1915)-N(3))-methyltransferase RlmH [Ruminococcaceae bacterium]|nr:23S rRNA (pseudouridine(1915)-N(3))-methyltransferase RlmH [Oscillospiraceae bacterium]